MKTAGFVPNESSFSDMLVTDPTHTRYDLSHVMG
jgi:hypothetical protein